MRALAAAVGLSLLCAAPVAGAQMDGQSGPLARTPGLDAVGKELLAQYLTEQRIPQHPRSRNLGFAIAFTDDNARQSFAKAGGTHPEYARLTLRSPGLPDQKLEIRDYGSAPPTNGVVDRLIVELRQGQGPSTVRTVTNGNRAGKEVVFASGRRVAFYIRDWMLAVVDSGGVSKAQADAFMASFELTP